MSKPHLKEILDREIIRELGEIIMGLEKTYEGLPQAFIAEQAHLRSRIEERKLEYRERTGINYST